MPKLMTKSELIEKITAEHSDKLTKKDVKGVMETLATIGYKELKKTGAFLVPGFAKFVVIKKPPPRRAKALIPSLRSRWNSRLDRLGRSSGRVP
jgi:DNA-binding protein HU-beta